MAIKTKGRKTKNKIKAIALLSGGLDSRLAVKMMLDQGIEVLALNFTTSFCTCTAKSSCRSEAKKAVDELNIKLKVFNQTEVLMEAVKNPEHGFGRGLNPCLDCRISMFKKAAQVMREEGARFIVTGEVLGERPMSQRLDAIKIIEKNSGLAGKILRPLSAKLFKPTKVEEEGIIDRNALLAIQGRSRKPQIKYAKEFGLKDYPCPAGGCLLTDKNYANRLKRLLVVQPNPTNKDLNLLRVGRFFAIDDCLVLIGRNEGENKRIEELRNKNDTLLECKDFDGPTTIIKGAKISFGVIKKTAALTARYSQGRDAAEIMVRCINSKGEQIILAKPAAGFKLAQTLTSK